MLRHRLTDLISGRVGRSEVKLDFGLETSSAIDGHVKYVEKKDAFLANRRVATTIKRTFFTRVAWQRRDHSHTPRGTDNLSA